MIGQTLQPAIYRIECVAGVRCWDDPFVMPFVDESIDQRVMFEAVDEVYAGVSKEDEEWIL